MPFTFSHPVAVLPIKRWVPGRYWSASALVVGSMAPDFEYFVKLEPYPTLSNHTFGVFFFTLPLALLSLLTFHLLVREPLIRHLPAPYDRRFSGYLGYNFLQEFGKRPLVILLSLLVGIGTHLLLDALTNPTIVLAENVASVPRWQVKALTLADHSFSGLALGYLTYRFSRHRHEAAAYLAYRERKKWRYWLGILLVVALLTGYHYYPAQTFGQIETLVTVLISGFFSGLVIMGGVSKLRVGR